MAKKGTQENPITEEDLAKLDVKPQRITNAIIKDDFCHYSYELMKGIGEGDTINRKGSAVVHNDMKEAFEKLNVHLAIIDDAYKYSKVKIKNINDAMGHNLAGQFSVNGFKIHGNADNESVSLIGSKWISVGGTISLETPKMHLEGKNYDWIEDLKEAIELCREEVELYMQGKCEPKYEQPELPFKKEDENEFVETNI